MWHDQIIAGILNSKVLYEYYPNRMSVNTPETGKRTHTKKSTVLTEIVLRGHPSHYQQCYHDKLTCSVNKVYMILLISIDVFLISMDLFPQLSPK